VPAVELTFGDPAAGWLVVTLRAGDVDVVIDASDVPNDWLTELVVACDNLLDPPVSPIVEIHEEPRWTELRFRRATSDDAVTLEVMRRPGHSRGQRVSAVVSTRGTIDEIVVPMWRALSALRGRVSAEHFAREWSWSFPDRELAQLGARLRARRANAP
jgi:hypothetical protein